MKLRSVLLLILFAGVAGMLGFLAFRVDPIPVDVVTVARAPIEVTVDVEGKTRIAEIYEVAAPIRGTARRSPVRVGDVVVAGETVVAIVEPAASDPLDPRSRTQAEATVREAEAGLHLARSSMRQAAEELELAESEHRRAAELVERGVSTLTRLEIAEQALAIREAAMNAAVSNLEMAKSTLDRARAALAVPGQGAGQTDDCCLQILAPADGEVLDITTISERPVLAGARLLSVGQPDDLEIVADVLSSDAVRLAVGDRAMVERWGGEGTLQAHITKIEPSAYTKVSALGIEEQRVDVILDLDAPVGERADLGHGFAVYLRIVEWEDPAALQVPLSALFRQGDGWAVFVLEGDHARLRPVETGRTSRLSAVVTSGLAENEQVLVHPNQNIQDGTSVVLRGDR